MSHSITAQLNKSAREFANESGVTFFVSLGEKNYDYKKKETVWTNYEAALFAKGGQVDFYRSVLVEGAVIEVSGTGLLVETQTDPQYKPRLTIQDAKLGFAKSGQPSQQQQSVPQQQGGYQAPQQSSQQGGYQQNPPQPQPQQQGGYQAPAQQQQQTNDGWPHQQ